MSFFEYEITTHSAGDFQELVYFCSANGTCKLEPVPVRQLVVLENLLNKRGSEGWELVQLVVGKDAILIFWKRTIDMSNLNGVFGADKE